MLEVTGVESSDLGSESAPACEGTLRKAWTVLLGGADAMASKDTKVHGHAAAHHFLRQGRAVRA